MLISLHRQATTTPKIRAAIQGSTDPAWMVRGGPAFSTSIPPG